MQVARVMCYLNQFFAGVGGEEKAETPLGFYKEPVGPSKRLQALLGNSAKIVVTSYCGDDHFHEHRDEVLEKIGQIARNQDVKIVVAGPAFLAGRYGSACVEVCHFLSTLAGLHGVTGMSVENPGVDAYKKYKDRRVFLFPTSDAILSMEDALSTMARFISKLAVGLAIGSASEEGYIPRCIRADEVVNKRGVERAVEMLLNKLAGRPFATEIPVERPEQIPIPPRMENLTDACIALACTGGVVPLGNPDGFRMFKNTQWRKYSIDKLNSMKDAKWEVIHGGYNNAFMLANPNYGVPLDACRQLEREKAFARLYPYFYATSGAAGLVSDIRAIGMTMVRDMKAEGVDAVLLVST